MRGSSFWLFFGDCTYVWGLEENSIGDLDWIGLKLFDNWYFSVLLLVLDYEV